MIKISQLKLSVEAVCRKASSDDVRHGIIGEEELLAVRQEAARMLHIRENQIGELTVLRRSMDARKKHQLQFIYQVILQAQGERQLVKRCGKGNIVIVGQEKGQSREDSRKDLQKSQSREAGPKGLRKNQSREAGRTSPVIVGMGPAGLFAALTLAEEGLSPVVIERGKDVEERQKLVSHFWDTGELDEECNVQFGEGGAGTFSDGKLNTLVKDSDGRGRRVLQTLVDYGAPGQILYQNKPHIGTDRLRGVVKQIRERIIELGGQVYFGTVFERMVVQEGRLREIVVRRNGLEEVIACEQLILATGHSARDTITSLYGQGIAMQAKPFAVGVRVQHPQDMIGRNQYGERYKELPPADYKLTYTTGMGRGVYSFCMCPGGYVVNASSEQGRLAVNGMSNYERDSGIANSAIVVTVDSSDYGGDDALSGIAFQRKWEEAAFLAGGGRIPIQLFADFCERRKSTTFGTVNPCMKGDYAFADVRAALPDFVGDAIEEGIAAFGHRIRGYDREDAVLAGIESRTSSPVRICRDDTLQANIQGIYPCGEGAGYAGGIMSAAMDGIRVAEKVISHYTI